MVLVRTSNFNNNNNISGSFIKYLSNILGKHDIKKQQKRAILCTAQVLRNVMM
jgi:hypothetical protein